MSTQCGSQNRKQNQNKIKTKQPKPNEKPHPDTQNSGKKASQERQLKALH